MGPEISRRIICLTALLVLVPVGLIFSLPALMIQRPDRLERADGLLHISVGAKSKADDYVIQLFEEGFTPRIVCLSSQISYDLFPGDYTRRNLIERGVPEGAVSSLHLPILECPAAVIDLLADYCQSQGWKSVIMVTSPEGNRRGRQMVHDEFARRGLRLIQTHSPADEAELRSGWWRTHWKIQRLVGAVMDTLLDRYFGDCRTTGRAG